MTDPKFDRLLSEIRHEPIDDQVISQAGDRVWKAIAESPASDQGGALRSCENFQALIPAHLGKQLSESRKLLFEDHVRQCVACRRHLEQARTGLMQPVWQPAVARRRFPVWRSALAAAAVAAVGIAALALSSGLFPGQQVVRAAVLNVDGSLYAVSGGQVRLIPAGYQIRNADQVRTAKGSNAVVRLLDGSLVEMDERSDISVSRGWKGTTIRLDGGHIIVQAARQRTGRLYVATDDGVVSVKGTIFSVNHGTKGSRVAVIEGVVRVAYGDRTTELRAGDEETSGASVAKVPIQDEIAWSKNSAKYLALLGDFALLQKQIEAIPGPGLRYTSDLLPYVPDHAVVYAAIPNLATTLGEASRLFQERLQQSPALRNWWQEQQRGHGPKLDAVVEQLKTFSSYLGDEIVFTLTKNGSAYSEPVILARVRQPGLEAFLRGEMKRLNSTQSPGSIQLVGDPWARSSTAARPLLVYVKNDMLVASPDLAELQAAAARVRQPAASHFAETPLYQQVTRSYQQGAGWLFCADMEQIVAKNVPDRGEHWNSGAVTGMDNLQYLTMERRDVGGKTESRAALTFASERQGIASWLAAPGSMGGLEFVSPQASMVTSVVIKNPRSIMEELFGMLGNNDPRFAEELSKFETKTGVSVLNDISAPLGGELTMAFDGPVLPTPTWKVVLEVNDPATLQSTISKLVEDFNREATPQPGPLRLTQRQVGSQTYFTLRNQKQPDAEINYTFVDSYLVAAPDIGTVSRAIQNRQGGYTLTHASAFQTLLPSDGYTNFSAIFYHNTGPVIGPLVDQIKSTGALTPQQQQSIALLEANTAPGLIYVYGEPERIVAASNTGFMGFDLGTLMTLGHGGSVLPRMLFARPQDPQVTTEP
jgi:ferric-dicitrate binding protein FerR (iron transport regulator)